MGDGPALLLVVLFGSTNSPWRRARIHTNAVAIAAAGSEVGKKNFYFLLFAMTRWMPCVCVLLGLGDALRIVKVELRCP